MNRNPKKKDAIIQLHAAATHVRAGNFDQAERNIEAAQRLIVEARAVSYQESARRRERLARNAERERLRDREAWAVG